MASPVFVNSSTRANQSFGTSVTVTLPASRVNGNLLILVWGRNATDQTPSTPSGWTPLLSYKPVPPTISLYIWYRFVDGTETNPTITWAANTSAHAYIVQYSGTLNSGLAFGSSQQVASANGTSTSISASGITTTSPNSTVMGIVIDSTVTFTAGQAPASYTARVDQANDEVWDVAETTKGTTSPAVSQTVSSSAWALAMYELRSVAPNNPSSSLSHCMIG